MDWRGFRLQGKYRRELDAKQEKMVGSGEMKPVSKIVCKLAD